MKLTRKNLVIVAIAVAALWSVAMLTLLILMASYNQPIADQYNYMYNFNQRPLLANIISDYTNWSGRLAQSISLGFSYKLFGASRAQVLAPIALLMLLGASFTWVIYQLFKFKDHRFTLSAALGFLLSGGTLYTLTCLFDVYLWLDAAFVYFLGLVSVVYNLGFFIWTLKNFQKTKTTKKYRFILAALIVVAVILQTSSEGSMALSAGWSLLALLATFVYKKWRKYRLPALIVFLTILVGSLVMVLSPGLWGRAGVIKSEASFFELVFARPFVGVERFFHSLQSWQVALTICVGAILGFLAPLKVKITQLKQGTTMSLLLLISGFYVPLALYFLGSRAQYVETRVLSLPCFAAFLAVALLVATIVAFLSQRYQKSRKTAPLLVAGIVLASIFAVSGFAGFNKTYLAALSARNNIVIERNTLVYDYLANRQADDAEILSVPVAPTMLIDSGATDFTLNSFSAVQWFYDSFARYYNLDPSKLTVHGEPILTDSVPEWYRETGRNACVPRNDLILDNYSCEYLPSR